MSKERGDVEQLIQVFEPHRASLPPVRAYLREFWARKRFSLELARFADKAEYLDSNLGKVWLVLNPLLLAFVYFLLVTVLRGGSDKAHGFTTLAHILIGQIEYRLKVLGIRTDSLWTSAVRLLLWADL
jgi:teichoic acid transport system permease protein